MDIPLFPPNERPDVSDVADWVECNVLATGKEFKRGDLKSVLSRELEYDGDALEEQTWAELESRARIFGPRWPLAVDDEFVSLTSSLDAGLDFYRYLCLLSLGQIDSFDRRFFEEIVAAIFGSRFIGTTLRIGHPASTGMDQSFRVRLRDYIDKSGITEYEVGHEPDATDNDLGLDVVSWVPLGDSRGADLHFLVQCATGDNWVDKYHDIDLGVWSRHIAWGAVPVRVLCVPKVARLSAHNWIRANTEAGLVLDRPRLVYLGSALELSTEMKSTISQRILELSAA